jgi:hypothetical protein
MKGDKDICTCGAEFIKRSAKQRYCSKRCYNADYRREHKEQDKRTRRYYYERVKKPRLEKEKAAKIKVVPPPVYDNTNPFTAGTIYMTIAAIENGESVESIAMMTKRKPEDIQKVITFLKKKGRYPKIVKFLNKGNLLGNKGLYLMPVTSGTRKISYS